VRSRDRILRNVFSHFSRSAKSFKVGFFDTSAGHPTSKWQSVNAVIEQVGGVETPAAIYLTVYLDVLLRHFYLLKFSVFPFTSICVSLYFI